MKTAFPASSTVLAVDVGTSAMKAALIDAAGVCSWEACRILPGGSAAHRAWRTAWWTDALDGLCREAASRGPVAALAISGHGPSMVALDAAGRPLEPAMLWLDGRAAWRDGGSSYYLAKLAAWRAEDPRRWNDARRVLSVPEWLARGLGAEEVTISPHPGFDPYIWGSGDFARYGFNADLFPAFAAPGARIGTVSAAAAERCGLAAGTPIAAAGSDFLMSLAGSGTIEPGGLCDRAGSSEGLNYCSAAPLAGPGLRTLPHLVPGLWNCAGILPSSGLLFEWFRRITGFDRLGYQEAIEAVAALPIQGDHPRFVPGDGDFGLGSFTGLRLEHGAVHLARAVVESIAFAVRGRLDAMEAAGCTIGAIRVSGGQAKNLAWIRMKADITGRVFELPRIKDAELLGGSMMAMLALGRHASLSQAAAAMVAVENRIEPDPVRHQAWSTRFTGGTV